MDTTEKLFIIIACFTILIYFLHYFKLEALIKGFFSTTLQETFESNFFQPNKIFRHQDKIFLLDTQRVLEPNHNPRIFNSFQEYQEYIISLEEELQKDLYFKIGQKNKKSKDIISPDIPDIEIKTRNKKEQEENKDPYYKNYKCNRTQAKCNIHPYFASIYDPIELRKFQEKHCQRKLLDKKHCDMFNTIIKSDKNLNEICNNSNMNKGEFNKNFKVLCEKHNFFQNNRDWINRQCQQDNSYENNCLLEDFFRENMTEFNTFQQ